MNIRFHFAILFGKLVSAALHSIGRDGAALPGLVAQKIDPFVLTRLSKQCNKGIILVCGTNGKTTTSRMLANILPQPIVHNRSGSNMLRGHIAAFLEASSWTGTLTTSTALLEVDEAILPTILELLSPTHIILHNLFRDQLDRYGEVDSIARRWLTACKTFLPKTCSVHINGDDPHLAFLGTQLPSSQVTYYGISDTSVGTDKPVGSIDAYLSPLTGKPLSYTTYYVSHLGEYSEKNGLSRPALKTSATSIQLGNDLNPSTFSVIGAHGPHTYTLPLPGLYSIYNALGAISVSEALAYTPTTIAASLIKSVGAFGRFERITYKNHQFILCLIKNPTGATEILKTIKESDKYSLAFHMHDNFADGIDISWYWDTPYELVASGPEGIVCTGKRSEDTVLRLKYANTSVLPVTMPDIRESLEYCIKTFSTPTFVLSTYTATIELQQLLKQLGVKSAYWKE